MFLLDTDVLSALRRRERRSKAIRSLGQEVLLRERGPSFVGRYDALACYAGRGVRVAWYGKRIGGWNSLAMVEYGLPRGRAETLTALAKERVVI